MSEPGPPNPGADRPAEQAPSSREQALAHAIAEFIDLQLREENVDPGAFCRVHPELEPDLGNELKSLLEFDGIVQGLAATEPSTAEPLPDHLSGHKILGLIGTGGMGRVLLAYDEGLGRRVAIKTLNPRYLHNIVLRTRFMQEARSMARLIHPNVVRIYNLGQSDEIPHFVMEYVTGVPLVEAAQALTLQQKVELMLKVISAVDFLHQNQIIHRDLKPGNILVGADLEPKLLDFGLAQQADQSPRLTQTGEVMGTPDYFSPEQARAEKSIDARSDVFSLGSIMYEILTGCVPFRGSNLSEQIRQICDTDPVLPRRIDGTIPGDLQNICLKALEKNPSDRYGSAAEMARDLERYLADEAVLANPTHYSRLMAGKIEQHVRELRGWQQDHILSWYEFDAFRRLYDRLTEREDAWILEVRRLSTSQVTLYLGAWVSVIAAALVLLFRTAGLSGTPAVILVSAATAPIAWVGLRCWKQEQKRVAIAYLLAFCLLLPTAMLIAMKEWRFLEHFSRGKRELELFAGLLGADESAFRGPTNAQMWWSLLLSLPAYLWLRRLTKSTVFSLVFSVMASLLCAVTLLRMGMLEWLEKDPGKAYFRMIPIAVLFFLAAAWIEKKRCPGDSRYFYPVAVLFTFVALSGVAGFHQPFQDWLRYHWPKTRGQVEYFFILNAVIYLSIQSFCEWFGSPQMRSVAKSFRFVIPGHVLTSLLLLGLTAYARWQDALERPDYKHEARFFEVLLPVVACLFVFGSVPKQMKNFFVTGLLFLAVGIGRLQYDLFRERAVWPVSLLITGIVLMVIAANYTPIKLFLARLVRRRR